MPLGVTVREVKVAPLFGESEGAGRSWRGGVEQRMGRESAKCACLLGDTPRIMSFWVDGGGRSGPSECSTAVEPRGNEGLSGVSLRKDWRGVSDRGFLTLFAPPFGSRKGMILLASAIG